MFTFYQLQEVCVPSAAPGPTRPFGKPGWSFEVSGAEAVLPILQMSKPLSSSKILSPAHKETPHPRGSWSPIYLYGLTYSGRYV